MFRICDKSIALGSNQGLILFFSVLQLVYIFVFLQTKINFVLLEQGITDKLNLFWK